MKVTNRFVVAAFAGLLGSSSFAQSEQTLVVLPEDAELPDAVTRAIDLPKNAAGEYLVSRSAVESSATGLATANAAREYGRAFGAEMAAKAADDRETRTRGAAADRVPDHVTLPPLPDLPAAPLETPVGPPEMPVSPPIERPVTPPGKP
jgi:hypothetical protein